MADAEEATSEIKKKSRKKLLIPIAILVVGLAGGGYFFMAGGKKTPAAAAGASTTTTTIALGPVVNLSPITLNLSDGHVLKVGFALQMVAKPKDKDLAAAVTAEVAAASASTTSTSPLGGQEAKALDSAIHIFGGSTFSALSSPDGREAAKEALNNQIKADYGGDVTAVYFTTFVMS